MGILKTIVEFLFKKPPSPDYMIKVTSAASKQQLSTEATFDVKEFKLHNLTEGPSTKATINREDALTFYTQMLVMRRIEAASASLYKERLIRGFCHLYTGQEACAVGMKAALRPGDDVITSYRCHAWAYLMGASVPGILSELAGKVDGIMRGKGGSMHLYTPNFWGGNGIIGAQVPLGAGLAYAHQYRGDGGLAVAIYGDGAANQGQIFEVYNMTKLMNTPIIYVCENNQYGMGTSVERASAVPDFYKRGDFVPGVWADGMDVLAVREATKFCVDHVTKKGPIVLELGTYRFASHSMSDPGTSYRSRDEVQEMRRTRDPITHFREKMVDNGLATDAELKVIEHDVKHEVEEAHKKAISDPEPDMPELTWDIYSKDDNLKTVRNIYPNAELTHKRFNKAINL